MMRRHSFDQERVAARVEIAVKKVLAQGYRTADIFRRGTRRVGTREMGDAVVAALGWCGATLLRLSAVAYADRTCGKCDEASRNRRVARNGRIGAGEAHARRA